ncbi:MAG TPA: hypothetical protein PK006_12025 [Saprospiraceae bacterium]|nr:hypothetical protein [Saprospiraceae bacterium]
MKYGFIFTFIILCFSEIAIAQFEPGFNPNRNSEPGRNLDWLKMMNPNRESITAEDNIKLWQDVMRIPKEKRTSRSDGWNYGDLAGGLTSDSFRISGRVRALDYNNGQLLIGAASGGVWVVDYPSTQKPRPLGQFQITSANIGAIATHPKNKNIILVGTGEPNVSSGTGLWKSIDGGITWKNIPLPSGNDAFTKIKFAENGFVMIATNLALYKSDDEGETFNLAKFGFHWDVDFNIKNPDTIYTAERSVGINRSVNRGQSFTKLTNSVFPTNFSRINLSICQNAPNTIYSVWIKTDNSTAAVLKTDDGGNAWRGIVMYNRNGALSSNIHNDQGWYDNMVSVSPTNPRTAAVGGIRLYFASSVIVMKETPLEHHSDVHTATWTPDGSICFVGTDGGVYIYRTISQFAMAQIPNLNVNAMPITQFNGIGVGISDPNVMIGGSQDNGIMWRENGKWVGFAGDGGHPAVDPFDASILYGVQGYFGPDLSFHPFVKTPTLGWRDVSSGLFINCGQWYPMVATDFRNPSTLFYHACGYVFASKDRGNLFTKLNAGNEFSFETGYLSVSRGDKPRVYCGIHNDNLTKLMVYNYEDNGWTNKSFSGVGSRNSWPKIFPSPVDPLVAYGAMVGNANGTAGKKIFITRDGGNNFVNITGNLPDVPVSTILENPYAPSQIYVGTAGYGVFRSLDGGATYERWDLNLPYGVNITTLTYEDQTKNGGPFFVVIGAYGHAIMKREIPKSEITSVHDAQLKEDFKTLDLFTNEESIELQYRLTSSMQLLFTISTLDGKIIQQHKEEKQGLGIYSKEFNTVALSKGFYLLTISDRNRQLQTKKFFIQ